MPPTSTPSSMPSSGTIIPAEPVAKPMSKLALLAQRRKEAAQARDVTSSATPSGTATPPKPSISAGPSIIPPKPLSKLAQKMATARATRSEISNIKDEEVLEAQMNGAGPVEDVDMLAAEMDGTMSGLFAPYSMEETSPHPPKAAHRPSPFFDILTSTSTVGPKPPDPSPFSSMHLPVVRDPAELRRRIREAFGPDVESPDDVVLRARQARASVSKQAPKVSLARK